LQIILQSRTKNMDLQESFKLLGRDNVIELAISYFK
jgi:hypothetical protein